MAKSRDPEDVIRELLVRELDTVNVYTEMVAKARSPAVRELLAEITRQEKHHIAEAMDMLSRFDLAQAAALERAGLGRPVPEPAAAATVLFEPSGIDVDNPDGETLLEAAMNAGVEIRHDCGGHGVCGTCRVELLSGAETLSGVTDPERKHLDGLLAEGWRLACQSRNTGPVRLRVPANRRPTGNEES